jgi:hypothetical protein
MKHLIAPIFLALAAWTSTGVTLAQPAPQSCAISATATAFDVVNYLDTHQFTDDHVISIYGVDASNDPDQLIGLPGQYVSKAGLIDDRVSSSDVYVEVFDTRADRAARLVALQGSAARAAPETYISLDRVLLRLPSGLTPQAIDAYRNALNGLCSPF